MSRARRGFSLLEVMIALAILVTCVVILAQSQSTSVLATREAQLMVTGTNLAQEKVSEVLLVVAKEGFTDQDHCEDGDFSNLGDETMDLQFGDALDRYHFAWCISQIDVGLAGDIMGMAQSLAGGGGAGASGSGAAAGGAAAGGMPAGMDLSALGLGPDMISKLLSNYVREVRVVVWWGEDEKTSKDDGDEIVITTHIINPTGAVTATAQGDPTQMGGQ